MKRHFRHARSVRVESEPKRGRGKWRETARINFYTLTPGFRKRDRACVFASASAGVVRRSGAERGVECLQSAGLVRK